MTSLRVIALPTETVEKVLTTMKSPSYGHPAHVELAKGHGPCRHCLRPFEVGEEERVLFTCNPFHNLAEIPLPGPVFVHADLCERYAEEDTYPPELLPYPVVMDGYGHDQKLVIQQRASSCEQDRVLRMMLEETAVQYVLVRDLAAGCFDFRVERA